MIPRDRLGRFAEGARANPRGRPPLLRREVPLSEELQDLVLTIASRRVVVTQANRRPRAMTLFEARLRAFPSLRGGERRSTLAFIQLTQRVAKDADPRRRRAQHAHSESMLHWAIDHGSELEFRQALAEHLALHPLPGELSDGELLAALTSVRHLDPTGTG